MRNCLFPRKCGCDLCLAFKRATNFATIMWAGIGLMCLSVAALAFVYVVRNWR